MDDNCCVVKVEAAEPMALKASLEGANMVTSASESTVVTRLADFNAPVKDVKALSTADIEGEIGRVRTVSTICNTPPLNNMSYLVAIR